MPACLVCQKRDATFRLPKSEATMAQWMASLNILEPPPPQSRLCKDHFRVSDIEVTAWGLKKLKKGAIPSLGLVSDTSSVLSDHTYSQLSKSKVALDMTSLMVLATVLVCWVPFLILLFYELNSDMDSDTEYVKKSSTISHGK